MPWPIESLKEATNDWGQLFIKLIYIYQMDPWRLTNLGVAVSKKMTETAGTVRGVAKGGKTATGTVPLGIKARAS